MSKKHFVLLDVSGAMETVAELFDDAIDLLPPNAVVFGGAPRDLVTGLSLKGDLDIAVPSSSYNEVVERFRQAVKWNPAANDMAMIEVLKKIPVNKHKNIVSEEGLGMGFAEPTIGNTFEHKYGLDESIASPSNTMRFRIGKSSSRYKDFTPMKEMATFVTFNNRKIQIISSRSEGNNQEDAIYIARYVDLVCCGIVMTTDGQIYEVVPGAYKDCTEKVLNINDIEDNTLDYSRTVARINKLEARGWTSNINLKKFKSLTAKRQALLNRIGKAKEKKKLLTAGLMNKNTFEIDQELIASVGGDKQARDIFYGTIRKFGIHSKRFTLLSVDNKLRIRSQRQDIDYLISIKKNYVERLKHAATSLRSNASLEEMKKKMKKGKKKILAVNHRKLAEEFGSFEGDVMPKRAYPTARPATAASQYKKVNKSTVVKVQLSEADEDGSINIALHFSGIVTSRIVPIPLMPSRAASKIYIVDAIRHIIREKFGAQKPSSIEIRATGNTQNIFGPSCIVSSGMSSPAPRTGGMSSVHDYSYNGGRSSAEYGGERKAITSIYQEGTAPRVYSTSEGERGRALTSSNLKKVAKQMEQRVSYGIPSDVVLGDSVVYEADAVEIAEPAEPAEPADSVNLTMDQITKSKLDALVAPLMVATANGETNNDE